MATLKPHSPEEIVLTDEMKDALATVQRFLDGTDGTWEWDDFLSVPAVDPKVKELQDFCCRLPVDYPPQRQIDFCNHEGLDALRLFITAKSGRTDHVPT